MLVFRYNYVSSPRLYKRPVTLWQNAVYSQRTDQQYSNLFPQLWFWSTT